MKPGDLFWGGKQCLAFGLPRRLVRSSVGVGDELMAAAVVRQSLTGPDRSVWFTTRYLDFLQKAELPFRVSVWDHRNFRLVEALHRPVIGQPVGALHEITADHVVAATLRQLELAGQPLPFDTVPIQ